jgi:hypothetical protein
MSKPVLVVVAVRIGVIAISVSAPSDERGPELNDNAATRHFAWVSHPFEAIR